MRAPSRGPPVGAKNHSHGTGPSALVTASGSREGSKLSRPSEFFPLIGGLSHRVTGVWSGSWAMGELEGVEAEVTYTRKDGTRTQPLPVTSTLGMEEDGIKGYRIFMDVSPLFADP